MRFLRKLIGLGMVIVGLPAFLVGGAGWFAGGHRDPNGAFTADLAPVRSAGPALVVPDVADLIARHRAGTLLTAGPVRVTVTASPVPVLLVVLTADTARRYLDGVARTEVAAVGFAAGPQPVTTEDIAGTDTLARLPTAGVLTTGRDVVFDPSSAQGRLSLLVLPEDLAPGVEASLVVGIRPGWLVPASRGLLLGGGLLLLGGLLALLWRTAATSRSSREPAGEPVSAPAFGVDELESVFGSIDEEEAGMSDVVERDEQSKEGIRGRWGNLLRRGAGTHGRHVASSTVDSDEGSEDISARDRFHRESPYIHTAT
jgi:hypothetical protein